MGHTATGFKAERKRSGWISSGRTDCCSYLTKGPEQCVHLSLDERLQFTNIMKSVRKVTRSSEKQMHDDIEESSDGLDLLLWAIYLAAVQIVHLVVRPEPN